MQPKALLVFFISILFFSAAHAQDTLYKRDGNGIAVKIKEISPKLITYKRFDNLNGPEYTVNKNEVSEIRYENGTRDLFDEGASQHSRFRSVAQSNNNEPKNNYGNNILSITPIAFIGEPDIESGAGVGIAYERSLDKKKMLSVYLPVLYEFNIRYSTDYYQNGVPSGKYNSFFCMPGIKFYPTGNDGIVRYSIGPSLYVNAGQAPFQYNIINPNTGYSQSTEYSRNYTTFGIMLNNSLSFCPNRHLYFGLDFGIGIPYIDNRSTAQNFGDALVNSPLMQFSFKGGFRF